MATRARCFEKNCSAWDERVRFCFFYFVFTKRCDKHTHRDPRNAFLLYFLLLHITIEYLLASCWMNSSQPIFLLLLLVSFSMFSIFENHSAKSNTITQFSFSIYENEEKKITENALTSFKLYRIVWIVDWNWIISTQVNRPELLENQTEMMTRARDVSEALRFALAHWQRFPNVRCWCVLCAQQTRTVDMGMTHRRTAKKIEWKMKQKRNKHARMQWDNENSISLMKSRHYLVVETLRLNRTQATLQWSMVHALLKLEFFVFFFRSFFMFWRDASTRHHMQHASVYYACVCVLSFHSNENESVSSQVHKFRMHFI